MGAIDLSRYLWPDTFEGRQPQYPAGIDWSNPLTKNLVAVISAKDGSNLVGPSLAGGASGIGIVPSPNNGFVADFIGKASTSKITSNFLLTAPASTTPGDRTYFIPFLRNGAGGGNFGRLFHKGSNECYLMEDGATGTFVFVQSTSGGGNLSSQRFVPAGGLSVVTGWHTLAVTMTAGGTVLMYLDGVSQGLTAASYTNGATTQTAAFVLGNRSTDNARVWNGQLGDLYIFDRFLSVDDINQLISNQWQTFTAPEPIWIGVAGSTSAALAGNAAAQASGTGSLTTAIPITAAALSLASASSALSTQIPLAGVAVSIASASGAMTAQIKLSAAALAQAVASAALSSGIILTASAVSQAAAQGTLSTLINMIANAQGSASASASLTAGSSGLSADAQAQASASASLTAQIRLSAAALAQAAASASLTAGGGLSANALAVATAQGDLTVPIALTAAALAQAFSSGSLVTQIKLVAHASGQVYASGQLQGAALVIDPRYLATLPVRSFTATLPSRSFTVSHKG